MFQVRTGGQILDLQPKQEISLTFDNPFFESDRIPVTLSTPITFPLTAAICRLFRFMPTLLMEPSVKKLPAELLMNGIVICSGTLVFNEYSEDGLSYTFSGAEFEEVASGNLTDIAFPAYEDTPFSGLVEDGCSGACPDFGLPQIMRKDFAGQSEYRTSTDRNQTPECSARDKYANWLGTGSPFVVPAIRVNRILEHILPDLNIDDADIHRLFDNLAILGLYKNTSTNNRFGVIPTSSLNLQDENMPPVECTLDLADTMPDMPCADFIANLLKMTCSTLFCDGRNYHIRANKELLASSKFIDWTMKVADTYACTAEDGQGYTLSFQNAGDSYRETNYDDPEQEGQASVVEADSMMGVLDKIKTSEDLVSVKHVPTGDVFSGWGQQAYLYYSPRTASGGWNETKTVVPLSDIAHQAGFTEKNIAAENDSQRYDCSIAFQVPRCVPTEVYHLSPVIPGSGAKQVVGLRSMTPVVEFPTIGGTRPDTVYIGLLLDNNFVDKGHYFTRPTAWSIPGAETKSDLTLAIDGENGLYERFHKTFAEWLKKPRSHRNIELNLSAADVSNIQLWSKYLIYNQEWFIKSIEITLNTSSDSIAATAEIVPA